MTSIIEAVIDEWWDNCDFKEMEMITGFRMTDFDPEDGYQAFVDACNEWWDKLTPNEKTRLYIYRA